MFTAVCSRLSYQQREIGYKLATWNLKNAIIAAMRRKRKTTQLFAWFIVTRADGTRLELATGYPASHFQ
jgi:hypothetical protein